MKMVRELTGGGVHYSFEAIGLKKTAEQAFRMVRTGGIATVIGMIPVGTMIEIHGAELLQEKKLQGSMMGSNRFRVDMPRLVDFYLAGKLQARCAGVAHHQAQSDQRSASTPCARAKWRVRSSSSTPDPRCIPTITGRNMKPTRTKSWQIEDVPFQIRTTRCGDPHRRRRHLPQRSAFCRRDLSLSAALRAGS